MDLRFYPDENETTVMRVTGKYVNDCYIVSNLAERNIVALSVIRSRMTDSTTYPVYRWSVEEIERNRVEEHDFIINQYSEVMSMTDEQIAALSQEEQVIAYIDSERGKYLIEHKDDYFDAALVLRDDLARLNSAKSDEEALALTVTQDGRQYPFALSILEKRVGFQYEGLTYERNNMPDARCSLNLT